MMEAHTFIIKTQVLSTNRGLIRLICTLNWKNRGFELKTLVFTRPFEYLQKNPGFDAHFYAQLVFTSSVQNDWTKVKTLVCRGQISLDIHPIIMLPIIMRLKVKTLVWQKDKFHWSNSSQNYVGLIMCLKVKTSLVWPKNFIGQLAQLFLCKNRAFGCGKPQFSYQIAQ